MQLNFENTETAFRHKSDSDLWKAKKLFQLFSYRFLVQKGPILANFALNLGLPVKGLIKKSIFHQFCGGETLQESLASARLLDERGVKSILDYSVEGKANESSYQHCYQELQKVIQFSAGKESFPFAVFKVTGIADADMLCKLSAGEELDEEDRIAEQRFRERFFGLVDLAVAANIPILIDAEESWIQNAIDEITYEAMVMHNKAKCMVYNTIQMYRTNRLEEISVRIEQAKSSGIKMGFKLVRGAYMEKERARSMDLKLESPIQVSKEVTDRDFDKAIDLCFENRDFISIMAGTHNEHSSKYLAEKIEDQSISKTDDRFWFAQLYGMSDHISFNLAEQGFNVVKYLPYGPVRKVLPYLSRRATENSSVKGQAGRELALINREIERRKSA